MASEPSRAAAIPVEAAKARASQVFPDPGSPGSSVNLPAASVGCHRHSTAWACKEAGKRCLCGLRLRLYPLARVMAGEARVHVTHGLLWDHGLLQIEGSAVLPVQGSSDGQMLSYGRTVIRAGAAVHDPGK